MENAVQNTVGHGADDVSARFTQGDDEGELKGMNVLLVEVGVGASCARLIHGLNGVRFQSVVKEVNLHWVFKHAHHIQTGAPLRPG